MKALKKTVSLRVFIASLILCSILVGALVYYGMATGTGGTLYVSPGVYPGAPDYTVWVSGDTYYAKNAYGYAPFSNTNVSSLLQSIYDTYDTSPTPPNDNLASVCVIQFESGVYNFTGTVNIPCQTFIKGVASTLARGTKPAYLHTEKEGLIMFNSVPPSNIVSMSDLFVEFDTITGTFFQALEGVRSSRFFNLNIWNKEQFTGTIFNIVGSGTNTFENTFLTCSLLNAHDVLIYNGTELTISGCKFGCGSISGRYGRVTLQEAFTTNIENSGFENVQLVMEYGTYNNVVGNWFTRNPNYGIWLRCESWCTISSNVFDNVTDQADADHIVAIWINGSNTISSTDNIINGNTVWAYSPGGEWGIVEGTYADYNIITSNNCRNAALGIKLTGSNSECHLCWNSTNWVS